MCKKDRRHLATETSVNDGKASNTIAIVRVIRHSAKVSRRFLAVEIQQAAEEPRGWRAAYRSFHVQRPREPDFSIKIKLFFHLADLHVHSDRHRCSSYQLARQGKASNALSLLLVCSLHVTDEGKGRQERRASAGGFRMDFARFNGTRLADVNLPALVGFNAPLKQPHLYPPSVERSPPSPLFHPRRPTSPPTYTRLPYLPTYLPPPSSDLHPSEPSNHSTADPISTGVPARARSTYVHVAPMYLGYIRV